MAMLEIAPHFEWVPVTTIDGSLYCYPSTQSKISKDTYSSPAIYRWFLRQEGKRDRCRVGQTTDLYERIGDYLDSDREHHVRIRGVFDEHCASGGQVRLDILKFEPFAINEVVFSNERLHDAFVRLALEDLCCAILEQQSFEILNFQKRNKRTPRSEHSKRSYQRRRARDRLFKQKALATAATKEGFPNLWEQVNAEASETAKAELSGGHTRQGTASAVPQNEREESGFSR